MAAPAVTPRGVPTGQRLDNGFPVTIAFALLPTVAFWEKEVTPPSVDGGDANKTSTMLNTLFETKSPKALISVGDVKATVAYNAACYADIIVSLVNKPGSMTIHLPTGDTVAMYAFINKFEPKACKDGEQPEADINIVVTNWDPVNFVEQGPVIVHATGT